MISLSLLFSGEVISLSDSGDSRILKDLEQSMEEKALMQQSDSYLLLFCVSVCLINLFLTQEGMVFFLIFAVSIFVSYNNAQREPNKIIVTPDYEEHY